MCGITAIFSASGSADAATLQRMTEKLTHRGPDGFGEFISPCRRAGLGHRRLSMVDLTGGSQPLWNESGTVCAVVSGEFYGFEEIRQQLQSRGHVFATGSDSEILLHLYEEHGAQCVHQLRGEFAFCLWDACREEMFVARDRFGIKPLFYAMVAGNLLIASEIKALFVSGVSAKWDRQAVLSQLFLCLPHRQTLYEGVHQLPPGCMLRASRHGVQVTKYWDLDYPMHNDDSVPCDTDLLFEQLKEALDDAVRVRLRADVPVCFFLSGGLDSSSVVGLARRHMSDAPAAFTVCFDDERMNEREAAECTARHVGASFHPIVIGASDIAGNFVNAIRSGEMVALNGHAVARLIHSASVHDAGYKIALSGSGADDVFGGYPALRQDLLEYEQAGGPRADVPDLLQAVHARLGFVPSWMRKLAIDRSLFFLFLSSDMMHLFDQQNPYTAFIEEAPWEEQLCGRHPVLQSAYLWDRAFLANYELMAERLEMAHALEVRLPFLDTRVFEVARQIPVSMLLHGSFEKYALRQAVRPVLADRIYRRRKHSFTAPLNPMAEGSELFTLMQDTFRSQRFREQTLFDHRTVTEFLDTTRDVPDRVSIAMDCVMTMLLSLGLLGEIYSVA
jgi:asparagine synthase (glutamine-hydrolysing)